MGFTRYYEIKKKLDPDTFKKFSQDCKTVCEYITQTSGVQIAGYDGTGDPIFESGAVSFNGVNDLAHESFGIESKSLGFYFTKTQRKPYDRHVQICLELAKVYFGDSIEVSSDGDDDETVGSLIKQFLREKKIGQILNDN
jgi:hypothetical protein